eukprot:1176238-Prorocentrum_minimum.AAC.2
MAMSSNGMSSRQMAHPPTSSQYASLATCASSSWKVSSELIVVQEQMNSSRSSSTTSKSFRLDIATRKVRELRWASPRGALEFPCVHPLR